MAVYEQVKNKALSRISEHEIYRSSLSRVLGEISFIEDSICDLKSRVGVISESLEVTKVCINKLSEGHISHLQDLVNSMLRTVFHDRDYSIRMDLGDTKSGKVLNLLLVDGVGDDAVVTDLVSGNGGGLQTVVGFVLQIYFIIYFKQERILFLDESLSAVSSDYIPSLVEFMRGLVREYGFKFVAIFHDTRFSEYADKIYNVSSGGARLVGGQA